jgi:hypothetical protein
VFLVVSDRREQAGELAGALRLAVRPGRTDLLPPEHVVPSQIWRGAGHEEFAWGYAAGERWWMRWPGVGTFLFDGPERETQLVPEHGRPREILEDAFRRGAVPVALLQREHEVLHASAVLSSRGVVAFCAASGTGKSTLAAALAAAGCEFWGDDFVAWRVAGGAVECAWSPSAHRLDPAAHDVVRGIEPVSHAVSVQADRLARLAAVVIMSRVERAHGRTARVVPVPASRAFTAVLPHAHECSIGGPERVRRSVERYLELCARTPVFQLAFTPDLSQVARLAHDVAAWMDTRPDPQ